MCTDTYTRAHDAHLQSKLSQAAAANDVSSDVVVVDVVYCCSSICLVVVFVACNLQTSTETIYTYTHTLTY